MKKTFTLLFFLFSVSLGYSQVLINQIYGGGGNTGATWTHDVIQLINLGGADVDISAWAIQYASESGNSWNVDLFPSNTIIPSGTILNVKLASGANGIEPPMPSVQALAGTSGIINMGARSGKVAITSNTTALTGTACPTSAVDYVGFGITGSQTCGPHTNATIPSGTNTQGYWRTNTFVPGSFIITLTPLVNYPLPVELINFTVFNSNKNVHIDFATIAETNSSHFEIERATEANLFKAIGKLLAAGNSSGERSYTFTDEKPVKGTNYYRLKMIDKDGTFRYSDVVSTYFGKNDSGLILYPNLVHSSLKISFGSPVENGRILIYNLEGKLVNSYVLAEGIDVLRVDVSGLTPGQYVVHYQSDNGSETVRFVKE